MGVAVLCLGYIMGTLVNNLSSRQHEGVIPRPRALSTITSPRHSLCKPRTVSKGAAKPFVFWVGLALFLNASCTSVVGMDLMESDSSSTESEDSADDSGIAATVFPWNMDIDVCKAYESVKKYVREGNHLHPQIFDRPNMFVRRLAQRLFPIESRHLDRPHVYVQAAMHTHIHPTAWPMSSYTPEMLPIVQTILQYLDLLDQYCMLLLEKEAKGEVDTQAVEHEDGHAANVDETDAHDEGHAAYGQPEPAAQNVGAAGVHVIAACNHYNH